MKVGRLTGCTYSIFCTVAIYVCSGDERFHLLRSQCWLTLLCVSQLLKSLQEIISVQGPSFILPNIDKSEVNIFQIFKIIHTVSKAENISQIEVRFPPSAPPPNLFRSSLNTRLVQSGMGGRRSSTYSKMDGRVNEWFGERLRQSLMG